MQPRQEEVDWLLISTLRTFFEHLTLANLWYQFHQTLPQPEMRATASRNHRKTCILAHFYFHHISAQIVRAYIPEIMELQGLLVNFFSMLLTSILRTLSNCKWNVRLKVEGPKLKVWNSPNLRIWAHREDNIKSPMSPTYPIGSRCFLLLNL